jgi:xanthine dehydrogenase accessory factor
MSDLSFHNIIGEVMQHKNFILHTHANPNDSILHHNLLPFKKGASKTEFIKYEDGSFDVYEPFVHSGRLIILGAGHVGKDLAQIATLCGFEVITMDERAEFANAQNIPYGKVICTESFTKGIEELAIDEHDYVCIMTRGHAADYDCLLKVLDGTKPRYLGQIGSKRKMVLFFEDLKKRGYDQELIDFIHAPIGLDIAARTPMEIAVAITAELIEVRAASLGKERSDIDLDVFLDFDKLQGNYARAVIVSDSGSAPRKSGAMLFVDEFGHTIGTIGGGKAEFMAIEKARSLLGTGSYEVMDIDMDAQMAEKLGMICGGHIQVLVEDYS